jgi:hypothetical protein
MDSVIHILTYFLIVGAVHGFIESLWPQKCENLRSEILSKYEDDFAITNDQMNRIYIVKSTGSRISISGIIDPPPEFAFNGIANIHADSMIVGAQSEFANSGT